MKRFLSVLLAVGAIAVSCTQKPYSCIREELPVQHDGKTIYGVLCRPEGVKKAPLVIISHGFGGTHQFGAAYADALTPEGFVVYCFDFCGGSNWSRSDGSTSRMSLFSEADDLKAVIDALRGNEYIDPRHVILIGESQGGMVSSLVAAEKRKEIERLILIYPALCIKDDWVKMYPALEDMPQEVDFWGVKLGRAYLEGLYDLDVYGTIGRYEGPVSIFHGDKDPVVNLSYSERAAEVYKNAQLTVLPGEGHGFSPDAQAQVIGDIKDLLTAR